MANKKNIVAIIQRATELVRSSNGTGWASWSDLAEACEEMESVQALTLCGKVPKDQLRILFAPTGPLQEVSLVSGWSYEYEVLADMMDKALDATD